MVDIESGSVGAAGLVFLPGTKPLVSFTTRERIPPAERLDPAHFFSATNEALKKLTSHVFRFYRTEVARAEELHIFLHAPWIVSKTRGVRKDFQKLTLTTEALLASVVQAAEQGIEENFRAAHREVAGAVRVVEKKITEFSLNGYALARPLGKETKALEMTLLESFAPENAVLRFGGILSALSSAPREWHGAAAACGGALTQCALDTTCDASLVLTAGSETTECVVVHGSIVREVSSTPFGVRTAARGAYEAGAFHSVSAAEAFLSAPTSASAALAPARHARATRARTDALEYWRRALSALIFPKITTGFFPQSATLLTAEEHLPFFEDALREPLRGETSNITPLNIVTRGTRTFVPFLQWTRAALSDSFLSAEATFLALYKN